VQYYLDIRSRFKFMTGFDEILSQRRAVVNFTITNQLKGTIFIRDRLPATIQVNNAESSLSKRDQVVGIKTLFVRAPMR
jgi:hypothetical protein